MRILLITDWNRGQGGAEAYMAWLRAGLAAAGDEVRLLTSSAGSAGDGSADYVAFGTNHVAGQVFLQIANPFAVATVRRALREFRPDAIVVNMFAHHLSPALFLALRGSPVVLMVTDYKCICPVGSKLLPDGSICEVHAGWVCHRNGCVSLAHWLRDRPRYALMRSGIDGVATIIACSEWVQHSLASEGIASEVVMLPVPPPGTAFRRTPASHPTFVFCGRLDVEKGVPLLLRAFARVHSVVPGASLRIIGRGPLRASLELLAAELHVTPNVTFAGWLDPPQVERHLADAWALVVPSLWGEPLGLIAIEGIVRGVPVIGSQRGGLREIIDSGRSGLLFPNGDENALTESMLAIAQCVVFRTHTLAPEVVQHAREGHSLDAHVEKLREVLTQANLAGSE
ncbi:MAG TPA: glycosyltransferase family 4 protein, partial [Candidatus Binataceae bacterium]|nr:glycosyltransferase family 4 protein [Candidatus Binataceae bacterium]